MRILRPYSFLIFSNMPSEKSFEVIHKGNLSDSVYDALRQALIDGQYEPGDRLRPTQIAKAMGVSITPVREAIFRLVSDQALQIKAATSIYVPILTHEQLQEIQRIRFLLEGEAAAMAAIKITPEELQALENIQDQFQKIVPIDSKKAAELNKLFHFGVINAAHSPLISKTLENMWIMMGPILRSFHVNTPRKELESDQHYHFYVLDALRHRDADAARKAIQDDIEWGKTMLNWTAEV